jgi:RNA 2',3'-cyclic 3'-phosphodiesterase
LAAAMRLFFGVFLPEAVRQHVSAIRDNARAQIGEGARFVSDEQLHLTLQFLGEVAEDRAPSAVEAAREVAARTSAMSVELAELGAFPNARRPQILWLGLGGEVGALATFATDLGRRLAARGFAIDDRKYHPHLTLARVKLPAAGRRIAQWLVEAEHAARKAEDGESAFAIDYFALIHSTPGRDGSIYRALETFSLRSGGDA